MRTLLELQTRLADYHEICQLYDKDVGYIVWRVATGDNLEMVFIETKEKGKGMGLQLYRWMAETVLGNPRCPKPYHSVYGFQLGSNVAARRFYEKMGWTYVDFGRSVYRDDTTAMVWITWKDLLRNLGLEE